MAVVYEVKWVVNGDPVNVTVTKGANETEEAARIRCVRLAQTAATGAFTPDAGTDLTMTRYVDAFAQAPPCSSPYNSGWPAFVTAVGEFSW